MNPLSRINLLFIIRILLILCTVSATAQSPKAFSPVQLGSFNQTSQQQTNDVSANNNSNTPETTFLNNELKEAWYAQTRSSFQRSFDEFLQLDPDHFSVTKAVYLSEAAFYDLPYAYTDFEAGFKNAATLVRQILQREKLNAENNTVLNYAIQKLYTSDNLFEQPGGNYIVPHLSYDFNDYLGEKDLKQLFVTKMLQTGTGQCHSMPLFYLCLAEQLHVKAYLSLAPNHTFIEFFDDHGKLYNFETTNGHLVSTAWLMQSTYVTAVAVKNKTFLDTLSPRRLYAQCLADLTMNYLDKMKEYDNLSIAMIRKILSIDSTNVSGLMLLANYYRSKVMTMAQQAGNPPLKDLEKYPTLFAAYQEQNKYASLVKKTGYQEMPKEAYERWLRTMEEEKQVREAKQKAEKLKLEINNLKKVPITIKSNPTF